MDDMENETGRGPELAGAAAPMAAGGVIPRVVVKFDDNTTLPYLDDVDQYFQPPLDGLWEGLVIQFPSIRINRLFTSLTPERIQALVDRAVASDPTYKSRNFLSIFVVECPPGADPELVAQEIAGWPTVEFAEAEGLLGDPPIVNPPGNNPRSEFQGYLDPAPKGIDARFAWAKLDPKGAGDGIGFVDMERGWMLIHDDLKAAQILLISGVNQDQIEHGTGVLGIVVAVDNTKLEVGIATHAHARVVSEWRCPGLFSRADALVDALDNMDSGDVLLLETEFWPGNGAPPLPIEARKVMFLAIGLGIALGIVIIEPAGNGAQDLQAFVTPDSGAIMVGMATETVPHDRLFLSNHGSRVDCYAWGQKVETLSPFPPDWYTTDFNGTSSASAIVAGAALIVQGVAVAQLGARLTPVRVRAILNKEANGTDSRNGKIVDGIGVMPDLRKILGNEFGIT